jgi:hypothetical protein
VAYLQANAEEIQGEPILRSAMTDCQAVDCSLMSYGVDTVDLMRRAAPYVDQWTHARVYLISRRFNASRSIFAPLPITSDD